MEVLIDFPDQQIIVQFRVDRAMPFTRFPGDRLPSAPILFTISGVMPYKGYSESMSIDRAADWYFLVCLGCELRLSKRWENHYSRTPFSFWRELFLHNIYEERGNV